jgi:hypothetical protein
VIFGSAIILWVLIVWAGAWLLRAMNQPN